jgi:hypothetical protein
MNAIAFAKSIAALVSTWEREDYEIASARELLLPEERTNEQLDNMRLEQSRRRQIEKKLVDYGLVRRHE